MNRATILMRRRTPPQKRISESLARFNVASWGRQSGKTTFGLDKVTFRPLQGRPRGVYWYVLQTNSAAEIAFNRFWDMHRTSGLLTKKPNESEKFATLIGDRVIHFKSGDNFQDLRAETLDGAIIDEYRQQAKELWPQIIRPMLSRRKGWCDFYSTPNGFDHFKDLYDFALAHPDEWATFHAPSTEAWWWTPEEIESARASMSEAEFAQEILAEFRNIHTGKVYLSEGAHNHMMHSPFTFDGGLVSKYLPITIGLDFNVNPMSWHLGQFRGSQSYWFDEIHVENTNTPECAVELVERLVTLKNQDLLKQEPMVELCGDATGESRNTKATKSDYAIITEELSKAGITWRNITPESNPPVKERVNTVNARLRAADGSVNLWYHPVNCPKLKRDVERVSWKQGAQNILDQTSDTSLTHASDSIGYPVVVKAPIERTGQVGTIRIIRV